LWLLFAAAATVLTVVVAVLAEAALILLVLVVSALLRDDLDRDDVVVVLVAAGNDEAASAKVADAGVDGLLARPLLVVLTALAGVDWMVRAAGSFFGASRSSVVFATTFSFLLLPPFCCGSSVGTGGSSTSDLTG
jgi:hypothetical protein